MKVDFMVIGAQKSGTTSMARQLATHPAVCFCSDKEPAFFNTRADWRERLAEYHALYSPQPGQLLAEASTMYTFFPEFTDTHRRLHDYNPDLKLVYLMREPVDRMVSNYAHRVARRLTDRPMTVDFATDAFYANRSHYATQLRLYLEVFPRAQILPVIFEEYVRDAVPTLTRVAEFVGIDPAPLAEVDTRPRHVSTDTVGLDPRGEWLKSKVAPVLPMLPSIVKRRLGSRFRYGMETKPELSLADRALFAHLFVDDVAFVEDLLGRRVEAWHRYETADAAR